MFCNGSDRVHTHHQQLLSITRHTMEIHLRLVLRSVVPCISIVPWDAAGTQPLFNLLKDILLGSVANKTALKYACSCRLLCKHECSLLQAERWVCNCRTLVTARLALWPTALPFSTAAAPPHFFLQQHTSEPLPPTLASFWCCQRCRLKSLLQVLIQTSPMVV